MRQPWLTILGVGEGGAAALSEEARALLDAAPFVTGAARHLALFPDLAAETETWPVPYGDGVPRLMARRGVPTVVLASGDPFWFGAGSVLTRDLDPEEWRAIPAPSTFALAAARLGWPLETTTCLGLHAAPLSRLRPYLAPGTRLIATVRDGDTPASLAAYLTEIGFGPSHVTVLQALGGPRERIVRARADALTDRFAAPVVVAIEPDGPALPLTSGRPDALFDHDGQITKSPIRALTLSALAPRVGEHLWDIGGGSGSIAIEWLMTHLSLTATTIERHPERAARIRANATALGQDRLQIVEGPAPDALTDLPQPDAIFIGGGLSVALVDHLARHAPGARLVANAVTLETEALLIAEQARRGGGLMRVEISRPAPIGTMHSWRAAYPVTQWSVTL